MNASNLTLEGQIENRRREIATERYGMSIGELTSLYSSGELIVHPEFQRFFRWRDEQKSRLIESILLGIPLPPVFVSTTQGGDWELVDGLQRVSTLLELQGELEDESGMKRPGLVLQGTKFLPALEGMSWAGDAVSGDGALSAAQQKDIRRARIDVQIIKRDSSADAKYDLFQRLNGYGTQLTAQELRSCLLVSVNPDFMRWAESLATRPSFTSTVRLTERLVREQYDVELVLRFLALHNIAQVKASELRNFSQVLNDRSVSIAENFARERQKLESVFNSTFDIIHANAGEDAFRKWDKATRTYSGSFLKTSFEVFALGLGYRLSQGMDYRTDIENVVREFWSTMDENFATGLSTEVRLSRYMPRGREALAPVV